MSLPNLGNTVTVMGGNMVTMTREMNTMKTEMNTMKTEISTINEELENVDVVTPKLEEVLDSGNTTGNNNIIFPSNQPVDTISGFVKVTGSVDVPTGDPGNSGELVYNENNQGLYVHEGGGTWSQVGGSSTPIENITLTRHPNATPGAIVTSNFQIKKQGNMVTFFGFINIFSGSMGSGGTQWFITGAPAPSANYSSGVRFMCNYNVDDNSGALGSHFPGNYGDLTFSGNGDVYFSGNGVNAYTDTSPGNALWCQGSYFTD